ncbi:MAG: sorbosone dehydrogenase family protein, partial [Halobacteria archaeon]|nr:sorbosone dehydrogenase family protein [Halobacteria archaeon]
MQPIYRLFLTVLVGLYSVSASARDLPLHLIQLPAGFQISLYASVADARSLQMTPAGVLFVGTRTAGKVYALADRAGDGRAEQRYVIAEDLVMPNGIAFANGSLYVAETHRLLRYDAILSRLANPPAPLVLRNDLPTKSHHGWRYLKLGPDNKLYLAIGAPCNICNRKGYAQILRMNLDGGNTEVYADGVRNSVGFDWQPVTKQMWFSDNGRDHMGDDLPPDELNQANRAGLHFGYPYCHGADVVDPEYGKNQLCKNYIAPELELGAHVAPLGLRFYTGKQFPAAYRQQLFLAEHGSWNRSRKVGYQIRLITIAGNR